MTISTLTSPRKLVAQSLFDVSLPERLQLLLDCIDEYSIYLIDSDGVVVTWNSGARKNKGYSEKEIVGKNFEIFFTPKDVQAKIPQRLLQKAARYGRAESEGWRVRKDGRRFWAGVNIFAVRSVEGRLLGFAKITQDRTLKLQQEALLRARDQAVVESEAKAELLARISHELRTPLNAVVGYAQALRMLFDGMSEDRKREYIDIINLGAESLAAIVSDIWDQQANEAAAVRLQESVNLHKIASEVVCEFKITGGATLDVWRQGESPTARADSVRVAQILRNFISNAIKYAGRGAHIRVGAWRCTEQSAEIFVDDDGPGVPHGQEEAIFGRYYRLDTRTGVKGMGFGLWFCRELAHRMDGHVGCGPSPLGGARFWLRLPRSLSQV